MDSDDRKKPNRWWAVFRALPTALGMGVAGLWVVMSAFLWLFGAFVVVLVLFGLLRFLGLFRGC